VNWQNSYTALTELHKDRLHSDFTRWYAVELSKPTKDRIQDSVQRPNFYYMDPGISGMAKATRFKFIMQIGCKEWKISSTKVSQKES